jgi:wyosine [tRNA(Phe)-imidazoG37] synthetase (radical SAM superfamily)
MKKIDKLLISIENFKKEFDSNKRIDRPYQFEDAGAILDSMQIYATAVKKEVEADLGSSKKVDTLLELIGYIKQEFDTYKRIDRPYQFEDVGAILDIMEIHATAIKKEIDIFTKKAYQKELEEAS